METREISLKLSPGEKCTLTDERSNLMAFVSHWFGFLGRGYFTFTLCLITQEYIWAWKPVNCSGKPGEMLEG